MPKKFAANFLNCAVDRDYRSSWRHLNFPFRDPDFVPVDGSLESRDPRLRMLVYIHAIRERKGICDDTHCSKDAGEYYSGSDKLHLGNNKRLGTKIFLLEMEQCKVNGENK